MAQKKKSTFTAKRLQPPQHQSRQPGRESKMNPRPKFEPKYAGVGKLQNRVAIITGGDSGIGRATAVALAREGASVIIIYLEEDHDARETVELIEQEGQTALMISGDIGSEDFCNKAVGKVIKKFGRLDILINNAAEQHETKEPLDIDAEQLERTFRTNVFGYFFMTKAALPHMKKGGVIINTTSVTAYKGHKTLIDYAATRGAVVAFTRSLSEALIDKGIRVNGVAPGPIWTPLIPSSYDAKKVSQHGSSTPMQRAGQPNEVAPCYVFLASDNASYMSGQILHPNGGTIVGS